MHEWALAESLLEAAKLTVTENKLTKVNSITVVLGELQDISKSAIDAVFKELTAEDKAVFKSTALIFETEPAELKCQLCGTVFGYEQKPNLEHDQTEAIHFLPETSKVYLRCPACNSPDFKIENGRGIYIKEIEGEN